MFLACASKTDRGQECEGVAVIAQCEAGNVRLVEGIWNRDYVDELTAFPAGRHDDQVDASSGAFAKLALRYQAELTRDLICSGDPEYAAEEKQRLTAAEVEELPQPLRSVIKDIRDHRQESCFVSHDW